MNTEDIIEIIIPYLNIKTLVCNCVSLSKLYKQKVFEHIEKYTHIKVPFNSFVIEFLINRLSKKNLYIDCLNLKFPNNIHSILEDYYNFQYNCNCMYIPSNDFINKPYIKFYDNCINVDDFVSAKINLNIGKCGQHHSKRTYISTINENKIYGFKNCFIKINDKYIVGFCGKCEGCYNKKKCYNCICIDCICKKCEFTSKKCICY